MKHEIVNLQSQVNKKESAISDLKQELIVRSSHHMNLQKNFSHILPSGMHLKKIQFHFFVSIFYFYFVFLF